MMKRGKRQFRVVTNLSLKWRDMQLKLDKKDTKKVRNMMIGTLLEHGEGILGGPLELWE